ncbi:hypothetical protein [Lacinutrix salivirga]
MTLTEHSDAMGRFQESAFNTILNEFMLQNPKTFNYATAKVKRNNRFCSPIAVNPILNAMGIDKSTLVPKLPIIGSTDPSLGVDYSVQIKELKVDFSPASSIQLPSELGGLAIQQFALKGKVCAGLGCGQIISNWIDNDVFLSEIKGSPIKLSKDKLKVSKAKLKKDKALKIGKGLVFAPLDLFKMNCFCLSLYAKVVLIREGNFLKLRLVGIELEDISPLGLENSIECYLKQMLDTVVFPKLKLSVEDLMFNAGSYFSVGLTPTSAALPFNPNISNNYLSIFLNIN